MNDIIIKLLNGNTPYRYDLSSGIGDRLKTTNFTNDNGAGDGYCSMFEWFDGNPNKEDREGLFVKIVSGRIEIADSGDADGVVCSNFTTLSNTADSYFNNVYQQDDFGRIRMADYDVYISDSNTNIYYKDEFGVQFTVLPSKENLNGVVSADTLETYYFVNKMSVAKINPSYNPNTIYIPRIQRPEWSSICLFGIPNVKTVENITSPFVDVFNGRAVNGTKYKVINKLSNSIIKIKIK